jgi:hypothetical protein
LEEVAKIARPLDVALTKENVTNNEDLVFNLGSLTLCCLFYIPKAKKVACEDFKKGITLTQMEVDKAT